MIHHPSEKSITIGDAVVRWTPDGALTTYGDGCSYGAHPHDTPHYMEITERCGYRPVWFKDEAVARANARLAYCREHEVCHHIVAEWIMGTESRVLWPLAHGYEPDYAEAIAEESLTMTFQRWLRAGERPIIGGVDWDSLKARAFAVLG